jgi:hydrogenase expression/formation protein HypD
MGTEAYEPIARKYKKPIVVTGFEPVDLLQGILKAVVQLEQGLYLVENQYRRIVTTAGNRKAQETIDAVFSIQDRNWRGLGSIPQSGYEVNERYQHYNARMKFQLQEQQVEDDAVCLSGAIMKGLKKPFECPHFGKACQPQHPLGAPMVSNEGACAAYYHYHLSKQQTPYLS